jgi:hypothetical protein
MNRRRRRRPFALLAVTAALEILADAFGPYPWAELDLIDVPLGSGVGGMEWPGAIWIETATFGGGVPGLGGLEELLRGEDGDLPGGESLLGGLGGLKGWKGWKDWRTWRRSVPSSKSCSA